MSIKNDLKKIADDITKEAMPPKPTAPWYPGESIGETHKEWPLRGIGQNVKVSAYVVNDADPQEMWSWNVVFPEVEIPSSSVGELMQILQEIQNLPGEKR